MNKPKYRFKRKDGTAYPEWLHTNMGELYSERKETGRDDLPILSVSIHTGISDAELDEVELGKRIKRCADLSCYKITEKGDLVFNMMRAWQGAVGCSTCNGMVSPAYIVAKPDSRIYPEYMNYYVQTHHIISEFNKLSYGVMDFRKRLYWDSFIDARVDLPCIEEQQKIAHFLSAVDEVIAQSVAEVTNFERQKKAAMKKIFSQEVRFKREDGTNYPDWETQALQEVSTYITITETGNKSVYVGTENMRKDCAGVVFESENETVVKGVQYAPNDVLISNIRPYLKKAWKADRNGICSTDVLCIRGTSDILSDFLYTVLSSDSFFEYVMQGVKGTKMPRGDKKHIMNMLISVPCLEEQQKIADFISAYEATIDYAKQELEHWKQLKIGLLQQMFG